MNSTASNFKLNPAFQSYLKIEPAKSLLIVEDDLSLVSFLEIILDDLRPGLNWEYETSGEAALARIKEKGAALGSNPFNLVIADIFLEGEMTGFDFWLECMKQYPDMPIIMTSSLPLERYLAILNGFNNQPLYLPKPITFGSCKSVIEEYF